eukprot:1942497-Prymnesium_polylepis.1
MSDGKLSVVGDGDLGGAVKSWTNLNFGQECIKVNDNPLVDGGYPFFLNGKCANGPADGVYSWDMSFDDSGTFFQLYPTSGTKKGMCITAQDADVPVTGYSALKWARCDASEKGQWFYTRSEQVKPSADSFWLKALVHPSAPPTPPGVMFSPPPPGYLSNYGPYKFIPGFHITPGINC